MLGVQINEGVGAGGKRDGLWRDDVAKGAKV